jgi:hypothetical protein
LGHVNSYDTSCLKKKDHDRHVEGANPKEVQGLLGNGAARQNPLYLFIYQSFRNTNLIKIGTVPINFRPRGLCSMSQSN